MGIDYKKHQLSLPVTEIRQPRVFALHSVELMAYSQLLAYSFACLAFLSMIVKDLAHFIFEDEIERFKHDLFSFDLCFELNLFAFFSREAFNICKAITDECLCFHSSSGDGPKL